MNLVFDIGNTRLKAAIFKEEELIYFYEEDIQKGSHLSSLESYTDEIEYCIIASVVEIPFSIKKLLEKIPVQPLFLGAKTPLPFTNNYKTRDTLGYDRIAAVAGACQLFPGKNVLIIDAGTAITFELKTSQENYLGGNISPGLRARFRALHDYTHKLPLLSSNENLTEIGTDTESAIINGVQNGFIFEVKGYMEELHNKYPELIVLLTGGDSQFFDNKLKKPIFVVSNLTLIGLNFILRYNAEKS